MIKNQSEDATNLAEVIHEVFLSDAPYSENLATVVDLLNKWRMEKHAVALGRKGGLANKGIPKPKSAENGKKGGRPKLTK